MDFHKILADKMDCDNATSIGPQTKLTLNFASRPVQIATPTSPSVSSGEIPSPSASSVGLSSGEIPSSSASSVGISNVSSANTTITNAPNAPNATRWIYDAEQVAQLVNIKNVALGNARLLYGSGRDRFYDVVTTHFITGTDVIHAAYLVTTIDGLTKILRRENASSALGSAQAIVDGLVRDTATLFKTLDVGDKFSGQQGMTGVNGQFQVFDDRTASVGLGGLDDTRDMDRHYRPARANGRFAKRSRLDY